MKKSGFTLTEMLVTIAVLAIVLSIAAPSFNNFLKSSRMQSNSEAMITALNYARTEAIQRGDTINLSQAVNGSWIGGFVVWFDSNGNGSKEADEELRVWQAFDDTSSVSSSESTTSFSFSANGFTVNHDVLKICDDRTGEQGMQISILISGAVIPEKVTCD